MLQKGPETEKKVWLRAGIEPTAESEVVQVYVGM